MPKFEKLLLFLKTFQNETFIFGDFYIDTFVERTEKKIISIFSPHLAMKIKTSKPPELQQLQLQVWMMYLLQNLCRLKPFRRRSVTTTHCYQKSRYWKTKMNMTIIWGLEILKKIQGPNALNLFLLDQKLKGIDCNKADEQMVFIAENTTSTVNRFAPLQTHSKPKNSAD